MKHSTALLITTLVLWSAWAESADPGDPEPAKTAQAPGNLLPNGDFSNGKTTPLSWQTIDGLSTYWVNDQDPQHGKVLKFDSDVLQSQAYQWWNKIAQGASPLQAPRKLPTTPPIMPATKNRLIASEWRLASKRPITEAPTWWNMPTPIMPTAYVTASAGNP